MHRHLAASVKCTVGYILCLCLTFLFATCLAYSVAILYLFNIAAITQLLPLLLISLAELPYYMCILVADLNGTTAPFTK